MVASKVLGGTEHRAIRFSLALGERGAPVDLAIRRGSGLDDLDYGSLQVHRLPFLTTWDPLSRDAVSRTIGRVQPDIVQTYMRRATRLTHLSLSNAPVHLARPGGYYALGSFRHDHGWIGNTKQLCDWMVQNGLPEDRVHHIYNFAEPAHPVAPERVAELRAGYGVPDEALVMVMMVTLGRLVGFKGHRHLVDAMARLPEAIDGRPLRLIIVGDGTLRPALHRQAIEVRQDKRILWTGWQKDPSAYLQMADLVVFPSLDEEPMGNVVLEAWAWRKPLVTGNFRGAREIVRHGEDGWTVPCADAVALAEGIRAVLSEPTLMSGLAERGHARVHRDFSREAILDQYLTLYRELAR